VLTYILGAIIIAYLEGRSHLVAADMCFDIIGITHFNLIFEYIFLMQPVDEL
jgi:hypothetical protein